MTPTDWRGVPLAPGATVVYPVREGSSLETVEAIVCEPLTLSATGRVMLSVVRRQKHDWPDRKRIAHVCPENLTVIGVTS